MYPNSSNTPSARGQELVPLHPEVLEGIIVDGAPSRPNPGGYRGRPKGYYFEPFDAEALTKGLQTFVVTLAQGFQEMAIAIVKFAEAANAAGLADEEPPTDPRARALWMKQHRNTGPTTPKDWRKR